MNALEEDNYIGFCLDCGAEHFQIEPDARGYTCEECDKPKVSGAEEILFHVLA